MSETYQDESHDLIKALHNVTIGKEYLEMVRMQTSGKSKTIFNNCIAKCDSVVNDITKYLDEESRETVRKELSDSMFFENMRNLLLHLEQSDRSFIEHIATLLSKGEKIIIQEQEKVS
jgi:hypothetical protein